MGDDTNTAYIQYIQYTVAQTTADAEANVDDDADADVGSANEVTDADTDDTEY